MALSQRWEIAQKSEQKYWVEDAEEKFVRDGRKMLYYKERASALNKWTKTVISIKRPLGRILEIGSGPLGVCGFIEADEKHAIDPLEHFYRTRIGFTRFRDKKVKYMDGKAEKLPYTDKYFDFVIIDNALDHALSPEKVLSEAHRVIKDNGYLYMSLHVYTTFSASVRVFLERILQMDKGHPHIFRKSGIRNYLNDNEFRIIKEECESPSEVRKKLLRDSYLRRRIYAFLGLAGLEYRAICCKN